MFVIEAAKEPEAAIETKGDEVRVIVVESRGEDSAGW